MSAPLSLGHRQVGTTVKFKFTTSEDGIPATLASGVVSVYKGATTKTTTGVTLTTDADGVVGLNHIEIATGADGTFYATDNDFDAVLTAGTVGSGAQSIAGTELAHFSLGTSVGSGWSIAWV